MKLSVEHINKFFSGRQVLNDVTFSVEEGQVCGLLGSNGAGKTTLLRIVNRILQPDSGSVQFDGHPITQDDLSQVGYLPEERGLYRRMRAGEQALFLARLKGMSRSDAEQSLHQWFDRLGIADWWNLPVNRLSKGMQQKLQFIVTVAHQPSLLVLDEPFSGFDIENSDMLKREILRLRDEGTAILFSTHNLQAANELCDKTVRL